MNTEELLREIENLRKELHTIPEPAFQETKTKEMLLQFLRASNGLEVVDRGKWFYAVRISATEKKNHEIFAGQITDKTAGPDAAASGNGLPAIAFRADFDAVEGQDGKAGHYCGHDGHASILAGFARWAGQQELQQYLRRDVYFIFQPAEEIGKGALLCRELIREKNIAEIYGFHNIPGCAANSVLILPETFACASTGLSIKITGTPSHAAYPEAGKNPSEIIARLILARKQLLQECGRKGLAQITVIGAEIGSSAYGVSASTGELRLTVRAQFQDEFEMLVNRISSMAKEWSEQAGMQCLVAKVEEFPATRNHKDGIQKLEKICREKNLQMEYPTEPFRWSEDFGYYLQYTSGAFFGVGSGKECPQLHTGDYEFPDEIIGTVLEIYKGLIE